MSKWHYAYLIACGAFTIGVSLACLVAINIIYRRKRKKHEDG